MIVTEGSAKVEVKTPRIVSRGMGVFYNPEMKLNRDVSLLLLQAVGKKELKIADPLAASGIRSIRFLLELNKSFIAKVFINDGSASAAANIRNNLKLNKLSGSKKAMVKNEDASLFLLKNRPFDYVDIDPFGSPVPFLDSAVKSLSGSGILAVTATDTSALSGSAPKACLRKYWATPLRNYMMHELGLRILIRRCQLAAASHEKALVPLYSYSKLHYMRVFLKCIGRVSEVDGILRQHRFVSYCNSCFSANAAASNFDSICGSCKNKKIVIAGPLWAGSLWDSELAAAIYKGNKSGSNGKFLKTIAEESKISSFGFYDTHVFSRKLRNAIPRLDAVIAALRKKGFSASRTHFSGNGIRTNASSSVFSAAMRA